MDRGYALITGASQGLGRAFALELARKGFGVIACGRNSVGIEAVAREAGAINGGHAIPLQLDVNDPSAGDRVLELLRSRDLQLSALVNNAGQAVWGLFHELKKEEHLAVMRVNMEAVVRLTHALLPELLKAPRAYVLNLSSMSAYNALASMAVYAGSKAFILNWSRSLRIELKRTPVSVTCVCPGSVITGFTERAGMQALDELARKVGTGPEPVAQAAVRAMLKGRAEVVPGLINKITAVLQKVMPAAISEQVASGIYLKRLPRKGVAPGRG